MYAHTQLEATDSHWDWTQEGSMTCRCVVLVLVWTCESHSAIILIFCSRFHTRIWLEVPKGQDHLPIPMLNSLLCLSSEWLSYGPSKIQLCREMSKTNKCSKWARCKTPPPLPKKNKIMFHQSWYWPRSLFEQNYAQWPPYPPPTICLCLTVTADTLQALQDRSVRIQAWNLSNPAVSQGYPTSPPLMSLSTALKNWNNLVNNKSAPSSPLNSPPPTH